MGINILNFLYRLKGVKYVVDNGYGVVVMNLLSGGIILKYNKEFFFLLKDGESIIELVLRFNIGIL